MGSNGMPTVLACELLGIGTKISITKFCNGINWRRNWAEPMRNLMMRFDAYGRHGAQIAWTERSRRFYEARSTCQQRTQCQCIRDACTVWTFTVISNGVTSDHAFDWKMRQTECDEIFSYNSPDGSAHTHTKYSTVTGHPRYAAAYRFPLIRIYIVFLKIISASIYIIFSILSLVEFTAILNAHWNRLNHIHASTTHLNPRHSLPIFFFLLLTKMRSADLEVNVSE